MVRDFNEDDQGKQVVTANGDMIGTVASTKRQAIMITPDEDLSRSIRRRLGWTEEGRDSYRLEKSKVQRIEGDEIRLRKDL